MTPGLDNAVSRFIVFGVAGWIMENTLFPGEKRYSKLFGGLKVPLLPVYGLGGIAIGPVAAKRTSVPGKFLTSAAAVTGVELIAAAFDRAPGAGAPSWDYAGLPVDLPHSIAWGLLGMASEFLVRKVDPKMLRGFALQGALRRGR